MADKAKKNARDISTDTALHILKGAIVKVLNTPLTTTVECKSHTKGKLSVEYELPEVPSDAIVREIEELANQKVKENVDIEIIKIGRKEAEEKYRREPVNNTFIYDKFPVPDSVTELSLVHIKGYARALMVFVASSAGIVLSEGLTPNQLECELLSSRPFQDDRRD